MTPWQKHANKWKNCKLCGLCDQRNRIVLGKGQVPCDILMVGEAPGDSENAIGLPFVGPAGKLLDQIIEEADLSRFKTAFTNLVCCYPKEAKDAGTNEPDWKEIEACKPRLDEFIELCSPRLVVAVGRLAETWINLPKTRYHVCAIAHPAAILRMPIAQKDFAFQRCVVTLSNAVEVIDEPVTPIPF